MNRRGAESLSQLLNALVVLAKRRFRLSWGALLRPSEVHLLDALEHLERADVQRLASELGVTKGAVSQMLTKLETRKLVRREIVLAGRREVVPALTAPGNKRHRNLDARRDRSRKAANRDVDSLSARRAERLTRFLERTVIHLRLLQDDSPKKSAPPLRRRSGNSE